MFTALDTIAQSLGCKRIFCGAGVQRVTGNPTLTITEERTWRRRLIEHALRALQTPVQRPEVFAAGG